MASAEHQHAVGIFKTIEAASLALTELKAAGFPMQKVSAIATDRDIEEDMAGAVVKTEIGHQADIGAEAGAFTGGTLGTITGLLVGLGVLAIPGIGPVMLAGAPIAALATTLAGSAIGTAAGGLVGALVGWGIPEERAKVYSDRVAGGEYLVVVQGTEDEIRLANTILSQQNIEEWTIYNSQMVEPSGRVSS